MAVGVRGVLFAEVEWIAHDPFWTHFFQFINGTLGRLIFITVSALGHVHGAETTVESHWTIIRFGADFIGFVFVQRLAPLLFAFFAGFFYRPDIGPSFHGAFIQTLAVSTFTIRNKEQHIVFLASNHGRPIV